MPALASLWFCDVCLQFTMTLHVSKTLAYNKTRYKIMTTFKHGALWSISLLESTHEIAVFGCSWI